MRVGAFALIGAGSTVLADVPHSAAPGRKPCHPIALTIGVIDVPAGARQ
jgi:serine acetyltransferase